MKNAVLHYYNDYPKHKGTVTIDNDVDKRGSITITSIKVSLDDSKLYTLNLYHTKCSFLVNGKSMEQFLNNDLSEIHKIISSVVLNGNQIDLKSLNVLLAQQLTTVLNSMSKSTAKTLDSDSNPQSEVPDDIKCSKCKRNVKSRGIWCASCNHWTHYKCERLSDNEISQLEQKSNSNDYVCKSCQQVKNYPAIKEKSENTSIIDLSSQTYVKHIDTNPIKPNSVITVDESPLKSQIPPLSTSPRSQNNPYVISSPNNSPSHPLESTRTCLIMPDRPSYTKLNTLLVDEIESQNICNICESNPIISNDMLNCNQCNLSCHRLCMVEKNDEEICLSCTAMNSQITESEKLIKPESSDTTSPKNIVNLKTNSLSEKTQKETKQSELRQRELKIKKREDQILIKEKLLEERKDDTTWFRTYIHKLETRISELEKSNDLLHAQSKTQNTELQI